jgi:SAM-dependent methyltransferase
MRGLEIGPLASPRVRKDEGRIFYVDHTDANGLRNKYSTDAEMKDRLDEIVDLDYVVGEAQGIYDAVARDAPFDYVLASHVIEHIPDPVGWLADIARALSIGGVLSLTIPDKRYCFDINRRTTDISEIVDAYLRELRQPGVKQVYDFLSKEIKVNTAEVWAGTTDYSDVVRSDVGDPDVAALAFCRTIAGSREFLDVHCSVFTPGSFLELYEKLARLGLTDFELAYFASTEVNNLEFHVSLRRMDPALGREFMMERQLASALRFRPPDVTPQPAAPSVVTSLTMEVSAAEFRLIAIKRRILEAARRVTRLKTG